MNAKDDVFERLFSGFPPRQETAIQPYSFASVDSAPAEYATVRSAWVGPAFLLSFAVIAGIIVYFEPWLTMNYLALLGNASGINTLGNPQTLGVRLILLSFILTFWMYANGNWYQKINLFFLMSVIAIFAVITVDSALLLLPDEWGVAPFSLVGHILSGYAGLTAIAAVLLLSVKLPEGVKIKTIRRRPRLFLLIAAISTVLSIVFVASALKLAQTPIEFLRTYALLGGIGPGLLLFYPAMSLVLAVVGTATLVLGKAKNAGAASPNGRLYPSVGIVVPAYNESVGIVDCLRSLDKAAAEYPGICRVYVVDNGSTDYTAAIAAGALAECKTLIGDVFSCPTRGKAHALNHGVSLTTEDIVMRLDSDTLCSNTVIVQMVQYFADPAVGAVGGLPLPKKSSNIFRQVREIEVYHSTGFSRVAQGAIDAITTLTGVMTAYRREALLPAGNFAVGVNGEDTDMTIRIGRLGYRIVIDPKIKVFTEVPNSWAHLKEQRIRWSRSIFHTFSLNLSIIWMRQGVRGVWFIPNSVWGVFRRLLVVLVLVYLGAALLINPSVAMVWPIGAVGALIAGPSLILTLITLIAYRRFDLLPFLPAYLIFRLARAYITLEMLFTLILKPRLFEAEESRLPAETA